MNKPRVLFVDDELGIRKIMPMLLQRNGYEVAVAASVAEALSFITAQQFDVLVSDMNIGEPGDGFTVVSAMRRTQPQVATIILTGYPDFEMALDAIRNQVDDYVTKPPKFDELLDTIKSGLSRTRPKHETTKPRRVADIISGNIEKIVEIWVRQAQDNSELRLVPLDDRERIGNLSRLLSDLVNILQAEKDNPHEEQTETVRECARKRKQFGYAAPMLVIESCLIQRAISDVVHSNLMTVDLSRLFPDMTRLHDVIHLQLYAAIVAFLAA